MERLTDPLIPSPTGNKVLDEVDRRVYAEQEERRNAVPLQPMQAQKLMASMDSPEVRADKPSTETKDITLTDSEDDWLPYLHDVESNWDLREQAYQDKQNGIQRQPGDVSNEYLLPGRKTVHGIDIATGNRVLDRDTGLPEAEEAYLRGAQQLRSSKFNLTEGYNNVEGVQGLSSVAEGVLLEDKGYSEFQRKINLLGVPPEQARIAWQSAQRSRGTQDIAYAYDQVLEQADVSQIEPPKQPDIDQDQLPSVEGWREATQYIYEAEEGQPFAGSDEQLIDWYTEQMSSFNWKIGWPGINTQGMAYYTMRALEEEEQYAQSLLMMVDTYDRVNTNLGIIGENLQQIFTDPVNLATVPGAGTLGIKAGGLVAKSAMKKILTSKAGQLASAGAGVGAIEGGLIVGGTDAAMQKTEQAAGYRGEDDFSAGQTAAATGIGIGVGAVAGAALGIATPFAMQGSARIARQMRDNLRKQSMQGPIRRQIGAVGDLEQFSFPSVTDFPEVEQAASLESAFALADSRRFSNNRELKVALQDRVKAAAKKAGVNLEKDTPDTQKFLRKMVVKDAIHALKGNQNAVGWYDRTVSEALDVLALLHPEIKTDADAKFAFTYALAVTSNGLKVDKNFEIAEKAYSTYKSTGQMPDDVGIGNAGAAINKSLREFNKWKSAFGIDSLRKIMDSNFTVRQLKQADFNVTGEWQDTVVRGAAILGPKIGNGFFSNLNGRFDSLTMDRWLMRTWGRMTGTLINSRPDLVREKTAALKEVSDVLRSDPEIVAAWKDIGVNLNERSMRRLAKSIQKSSMLPANRAVMNRSGKNIVRPKGDKGKTETATPGDFARRIGNGLVKDVDGQKEAPTTADRNRIRAAFAPALNDLRQMGYGDMTMADLQAVLWYPEKRLYDKAKSKEDVAEGYTDDEAPDYANAARQLAQKMGVDDETIEKEIARGRAARARPAGGAGAPQSNQSQGGGFAKGERSRFLRENVYSKELARLFANGKASAYSGKSGGAGAGTGGVKQVFTPSNKYIELLANAELPAPTLHELKPTQVDQFVDALSASKAASKYGPSVYIYNPSEYANMRLFQTADGSGGFAVKEDGDIVSVYSAGGGQVFSMMQLAVEQGGTKLDATDTGLPELYSIAGFREVDRAPWDDDLAPDDWDKSVYSEFNNGEPDIVFMKHGDK